MLQCAKLELQPWRLRIEQLGEKLFSIGIVLTEKTRMLFAKPDSMGCWMCQQLALRLSGGTSCLDFNNSRSRHPLSTNPNSVLPRFAWNGSEHACKGGRPWQIQVQLQQMEALQM